MRQGNFRLRGAFSVAEYVIPIIFCYEMVFVRNAFSLVSALALLLLAAPADPVSLRGLFTAKCRLGTTYLHPSLIGEYVSFADHKRQGN